VLGNLLPLVIGFGASPLSASVLNELDRCFHAGLFQLCTHDEISDLWPTTT